MSGVKLTHNMVWTLKALSRYNLGGSGLRPVEINEFDPSRTYRTLCQLRKKGLVVRNEPKDKWDGRYPKWKITDKGRELLVTQV